MHSTNVEDALIAINSSLITIILISTVFFLQFNSMVVMVFYYCVLVRKLVLQLLLVLTKFCAPDASHHQDVPLASYCPYLSYLDNG